MKNKKNKGALHLMLALCTMGSLAACSSDDVLSNIKETDDAVKITVSTRNGDTGTTENPWIENDRIALSAIGHQPVTYQWNGNTWSPESILYWPKGQKCSFMGYYPTTATNSGLSFTIPTDQSDATKLHAADYMTTDLYYAEKSSANPANQQIEFNFRHRLAKVVINITSYGSEFDAATPTLFGESIMSQGSGVNVTANTANSSSSTVEKTGDVVRVNPFKGTSKEGKPCYTALVSPTAVDNNSMLMVFSIADGYTHRVNYPNTLKELKSGKAYTFNIKVGRDKVEVGDVTVTGWDEEIGGNKEDNVPTLAQLLTEEYKALREVMTILTLDGPTLDPNIQPNCWGRNFTTYFPNVTTLNITGRTIPNFGEYNGILYDNHTVKTVIGNDITSLPDDAFCWTNGVTTYTFPNLTEAGNACFLDNSSLKEISLPKLKALSEYLFHMYNLDKACFASLTDFSNVEWTFSGVSHLAFGSTKEFTFDGKTPADMYYDYKNSAAVRAAKTTLYLDENGFEYKNYVSVSDTTWRDVKFKAIEPYSKYPGKKD